MNAVTKVGISELTEKEKLTLRLMVRGHDAKSIARDQGLSVHTVNERLRDARRKMEVSSSREAARLLLEAEGGEAFQIPHFLGDSEIGADPSTVRADESGQRRKNRPFLIGGLLMTIALSLLAFVTLSPGASTQTPTLISAQEPNIEVVQAAQNWLQLIDEERWAESYQLTGSAFRKINSLDVWTKVSEQVRQDYGAALSRTLVSQEWVPAPPNGYQVVKFRTQFQNKSEPLLQTVTLERENAGWRVVAIVID